VLEGLAQVNVRWVFRRCQGKTSESGSNLPPSIAASNYSLP
jgi:hypothetical protein